MTNTTEGSVTARTMTEPSDTSTGPRLESVLGYLLAGTAVVGSIGGLITGGGPGRHAVETSRGESVTLYGDGLYAWDTLLIGTGNRGQDVAILAIEVPALLLALRWSRRGGVLAAAVLTGVLAFFAYFYVSMVFATAQNRLFPAYVAAAALAGFALVRVASRLNTAEVACALPERPGRRVLATYLFAVAAALTVAWLPETLAATVTGEIAGAVGPYTSQVTHALDLGVVVPVAIIAAAGLRRGRPIGSALALVLLVVNVCIGTLLIAQGIAQLTLDVPLTVGEIVAKMLSFAVLTLVAGGLLLRMAIVRAGHQTGQHLSQQLERSAR